VYFLVWRWERKPVDARTTSEYWGDANVGACHWRAKFELVERHVADVVDGPWLL